MKTFVSMMAFAMLALQPAAFAASDLSSTSGSVAKFASSSDDSTMSFRPGGGPGRPGGGHGGGGHGPGGGGPGGPGGGHGGGGHGPGGGHGGGGWPGGPGGGHGGGGGGWPGGGHGGGHGPGPGPRGYVCYAQNLRGQTFSGYARFANEAQREALWQCQRVSARCRPAGCNVY